MKHEHINILIRVAAVLGEDHHASNKNFYEFEGLCIYFKDKIFAFNVGCDEVYNNFKIRMALLGVMHEAGFTYEEYEESVQEGAA